MRQVPTPRRLAPFLLGAILAAGASPATAAELTLFVSGASPSLAWKGGVGGAFAITLFNIGGVEMEGAHQTGEVLDSGLLTVAGRIFIAPPIGRFVPYAGLSAGVYRATLGSEDDWGTSSGVFVGAKLKLALGLSVRGEYQWVHFPEGALVPMDARYSAGVSLSF
jgi:opacity protein-like surface antigen